MLKHKFLGLLACGSMALGVVGCDSDEGGTTTVASATGTGTDDSGSSEADSDADGSTSEGEDTSDNSTSTSTTSDGSDTSSCSESDPCQVDSDCNDGESCIDCVCFGGVTTDPTDSGGTDSGGTGDPAYPNPAGGCPEGTLDGNEVAEPGINVCIPVCNPMAADVFDACPQPTGSMTLGGCLLTLESMGDACNTMMGNDPAAGENCEDPDDNGFGRYCIGVGGGMFNCVAAAGCLPLCGNGVVCPEGMTCDGQLCTY